MQWVDRALATMSPYDVAQLVETYVESVPVEESFTALKSAIPEMAGSELAQLGLAFDLSDRDARPYVPVLFGEIGPSDNVSEHFRTCPPDFKERLIRFLRWNPRVLARFPKRDVERMFHLTHHTRRLPIAIVSAAGIVVLLAGFATVALRVHAVESAAPDVGTILATPSPAAAIVARPAIPPVAPRIHPRPAQAVATATPGIAHYQQRYTPQYQQQALMPSAVPRATPTAPPAQANVAQARPAPPAPRWDGTWKYDPLANRYINERGTPWPAESAPPQDTATTPPTTPVLIPENAATPPP